jgi:branched-chain amino acid transport system permease protein
MAESKQSRFNRFIMTPYRWKFIVLLAFFAALLSACSSSIQSPTSVPTTISTSTSPYDGSWEGSGTAQDGRTVMVKFTVQGGAISSFTYIYPRPDNIPCTGIDHEVISLGSQPRIVNASFSQVFGPDLTADGTFTSPTAASGHISMVWQGRAYLNSCNAYLHAAWTASKQQAAQTVTVAAPVASAWCGKNTNCNDLLVQLLIFGLVNGAILALNAIGVTVIYSTVRTLNLAHGDVFALTTAFITSTINIIGLNLDWSPSNRALILALIFIGAIAIGALLSVGVEALAFRPFRGRSKLAPLIASLGLSFILFQAAILWRTYQKSFVRGEHRSVPGLNEVPTDGIPNFFPAGNLLHGKVVLQYSDVFVLAVGILFVVITTLILARTQLGRSIRAVAQNEELAQMVGVNRDSAIRRAFALGGALAGAAAFIFAMYYSRPFGQDGAESGLFAFAAALMGGVGSPIGAMTSGAILGVVGSFSDYFFTAQWTPVLLLGLLTAILVWRRGGLLNRDEGLIESGARDSVVLTAPVQSQNAKRWLIALFAVLIFLPVLNTQFKLTDDVILRGLGIFILLTLGLNILLGLAGVLDLGYAMSFAIGAYTAAILTNRYGILVFPQFDFTMVLLISAAAAALFGVLKGATATRLRGDYLAVATLALGLLTEQAITNSGNLTGGPMGLSALPPPHLFGLTVAAPFAQYYLVLGFVLLAAFISGRLMTSRTGRAWIASSEDETAAVSFGVDAARYRLLAFVFSSALAGVAGALYANTFSYIDPSLAAFDVSSLMLAMVILGGAGSVGGAVLGTALVYFYDKVFVPQLFAWIALLWPQGVYIGMVPDLRGTNFFDFGIVLYLTVLWRARDKKTSAPRAETPPRVDETIKPQVAPSPRE